MDGIRQAIRGTLNLNQSEGPRDSIFHVYKCIVMASI